MLPCTASQIPLKIKPCDLKNFIGNQKGSVAAAESFFVKKLHPVKSAVFVTIDLIVPSVQNYKNNLRNLS